MAEPTRTAAAREAVAGEVAVAGATATGEATGEVAAGDVAEVARKRAFVLAETALGAPPAVPELRLHLAEDVTTVWSRAEAEFGTEAPPFWAFAWAGGQAVARYLLDHPRTVAGRTVVDLAAGSGVVAIAAALAGADSVIATEIDALAIEAIALNAAANGVRVTAVCGDVLGGDGEGADVVLAGDVWYSREMATRVTGLLDRAAARGAAVLVGDPGRAYLPRQRFAPVAAYDIPVTWDLESADLKRTTVWRPAHGDSQR